MAEAEAVCDRVAIMVSGRLRWVPVQAHAGSPGAQLAEFVAVKASESNREALEATTAHAESFSPPSYHPLPPPPPQMYWGHPAPKEQVWQGLPAGDESEDPHTGRDSPQRNSQAFPPGRTAGKVKVVADSHLKPNVSFPDSFTDL